jgi:site-specific DNA-methyltransferase (adenine-specific)
MNQLYFGDNLTVLKDHIKDESVDLIYLDPPFKSDVNYNVLFKGDDGVNSDAQVEAFRDTWRWGDVSRDAYEDVMEWGGETALVLRGLGRRLISAQPQAH